MASKFFEAGTVVDSDWLNDVNDTVYEAQGSISGSTNRTARSKFADIVSVKDFGAVGDGVTDDLTALNAAIAYEQTNKKGLYFPAGTYLVSATLAFLGSALRDLSFIALGKVTIYCTGAGPVATLDSGADDQRCDNISLLGDWVFKGNATSTYGLDTRGIHRSKLEARAVDVATAGFRTRWSVLTEHTFKVTDNIDTFSVNPDTGLIITESSSGNYSAANKYHVVMEGPITNLGIDYVYGGLGNIFTGTSEALPRGFRQRSTAQDALLLGMDFEGNSVYDILAEGRALQLLNCNSSSSTSSSTIALASTCTDFSVRGGFCREINIDAAAVGTTINDTVVSDNVALGITGAGAANWRGSGNHKGDTSAVITSDISDQFGATGTYAATLTGCTTSPASTIDYARVGDYVTLNIPTITGTSNTTAATITGMPAAIRPSTTRADIGITTDNSGNVISKIEITSGGVLTLHNNLSATFTNSGTKGIQACTISYKV